MARVSLARVGEGAMIQRVCSGSLDGIDGFEVVVEVDAGRGLPSFQLVGLPSTAVRESRERVLSALRNCALGWPKGRVVVNLAPADVEKKGPSVDLAIAVGVCGVNERAEPGARGEAVLLGELSLDGALRPVRGLLAIVTAAAAAGRGLFVVPRGQAWEAALVPDVTVLAADSLADVVRWRAGRGDLERVAPRLPLPADREPPAALLAFLARAPARARRLAVLAAAGRHDLLLVGPPGSGKTQLSRVVGSLQPALGGAEALEVARIHGAAGLPAAQGLDLRRPFRAPHHTATRAGLLGGGASLRPGEITLAHRGILFLDELSEFSPGVLDALREPLEEGRVAVARGAGTRFWPADFQLLAATNPCRCGWHGSRRRECRCTERLRAAHRGRLSGPLLDRIDLFAELEEPEGPLHGSVPDDPRRLWELALAEAAAGHALLAGRSRARPASLVEARGLMEAPAAALLEAAGASLGLTVRSLVRCAGVARTLAALGGRTRANRDDVVEALSWRREQLAALA